MLIWQADPRSFLERASSALLISQPRSEVVLIPAQARRGLGLNPGLGAALWRLIVVLVAAVPLLLLAVVRVVRQRALAAALLVPLVVAALVGGLVRGSRRGLVADPTHKPIRQLDAQL